MNSAVTVLTVFAGLVFSIACGLLVEELIFGGIFRLMASRIPVQQECEQRPNHTGFAKYHHSR